MPLTCKIPLVSPASSPSSSSGNNPSHLKGTDSFPEKSNKELYVTEENAGSRLLVARALKEDIGVLLNSQPSSPLRSPKSRKKSNSFASDASTSEVKDFHETSAHLLKLCTHDIDFDSRSSISRKDSGLITLHSPSSSPSTSPSVRKKFWSTSPTTGKRKFSLISIAFFPAFCFFCAVIMAWRQLSQSPSAFKAGFQAVIADNFFRYFIVNATSSYDLTEKMQDFSAARLKTPYSKGRIGTKTCQNKNLDDLLQISSKDIIHLEPFKFEQFLPLTNKYLSTRSWVSAQYFSMLFRLNRKRIKENVSPFISGLPWAYRACDAYIVSKYLYQAHIDINNLSLNSSFGDINKIEDSIRKIFQTRYVTEMNSLSPEPALYVFNNKTIRSICIAGDPINKEMNISVYIRFLVNRVLPLLSSRVNVWKGQDDHPLSYIALKTLLRSPKIARIFLENSPVVHEKVSPIPIGFSGYTLHQQAEHFQLAVDSQRPWNSRLNSVYFGGFENRSYGNRKEAYAFAEQYCTACTLFSTFSSVGNNRGQPYYKSYWTELSKYKFVFSPWGIGWDCYRTYEILALGSVPIIVGWPGAKQAYQDLPVVVIENLGEINKINLLQWANKFGEWASNLPRTLKLLSPFHWMNKVNDIGVLDSTVYLSSNSATGDDSFRDICRPGAETAERLTPSYNLNMSLDWWDKFYRNREVKTWKAFRDHIVNNEI